MNGGPNSTRRLERLRPAARPVLTALLVGALLLPLACAGEGEAARSKTVDWLVDYLRIDTSNPPGNEEAAARYLSGILESEGIASRLLVSPEGRTSIVARLEPVAATAEPGAALVLTHHMDVVPAGPGWTVEPFAGRETDGWIWGRGAIDVKSLGIAQLAAFVELHRGGGPRQRPVIYLAVADEESGGAEGTAWLLEEHPEIFADAGAVLGEGGANRVISGHHLWWGIETAQKRPLWLKATAYGRAGHGSMLNPASAPHQLMLALSRVIQRPREFRVTAEAKRYLEAAAVHQSAVFQEMVEELDEIVAGDEPERELFPGVANYLLDTIQVNVVEAGERVNVVPKSASALIDIRLLPGTDEKAMLEEVRALLGPRIELETLLSAAPAQASPVDHEIYRCLERALSPSGPVIPAFIPGVTDSRYYRQRGIPAYGFSPFSLDGVETRGIHADDERISSVAFQEGVDLYVDVVTACSGS